MLVLVCRLCGVVGLDRLCEDLIAALAAAVGAHMPATPGSPGEQKQVAALAALVSLAAGPSAALIGSGWVTILRTLSAIDALQVSFSIFPACLGPRLCFLYVIESLTLHGPTLNLFPICYFMKALSLTPKS